jgi:hypothetical protein
LNGVVNATSFSFERTLLGRRGAKTEAKRGSDSGRNLLDKELRHDGGGCSAKVGWRENLGRRLATKGKEKPKRHARKEVKVKCPKAKAKAKVKKAGRESRKQNQKRKGCAQQVAEKRQGDPSGCETSQQSNPCNNHTALGLPHPWDFFSLAPIIVLDREI